MIRNFAICVFVFLSLTVIVGCKKKAADASEPIQSAESVPETVFSPETEAESTVQPAEEGLNCWSTLPAGNTKGGKNP